MSKIKRKGNESLEALLRRFRALVGMKNVQSKSADSPHIKPASRKKRKRDAIFLANSKKKSRAKWMKV